MKIKFCFPLSAERRWLFSLDQGSTYLLCQLTTYESFPLHCVTEHEVFVKMSELMKYNVPSTEDAGRVTRR